jgi:hypothetical protein
VRLTGPVWIEGTGMRLTAPLLIEGVGMKRIECGLLFKRFLAPSAHFDAIPATWIVAKGFVFLRFYLE